MVWCVGVWRGVQCWEIMVCVRPGCDDVCRGVVVCGRLHWTMV